MRYTLCIVFSLLIFVANAQIKPGFFPEDATEEGIVVRCLCEPGVQNKSRSRGLELKYSYLSGGNFKPEDSVFQKPYSALDRIQQFEIDLKVPVINKEGLKLLLGYKYFLEKYNFKQVGPDYKEVFQELGDRSLKSSSLSMYLTKPLNETRYLAFRLRYSSNGNYKGIMSFDQKSAIYKALGMYAIKKSSDMEWGFGINYAKSFRRDNILPFVLFNKNFNRRWGIESAIPGYVMGRFNADEKTILLFGAEYESQSYRVDVPETSIGDLDIALNHSEVIFSVEMERMVSKWIWANLMIGYQLNFSTDFETKSDNFETFNAEPTNAFLIRLGIFLSPPDER